MGYINCLNLLDKAEVFIPTAALLALVLLVWTQLQVWGQEREGERQEREGERQEREGERRERNFNPICGRAWAYLAILFALTAVALFICNISAYDKGFLVLAFLMTVVIILITFGLIIADFVWDLYRGGTVGLLGRFGQSRFCGLIWLSFFIGLLLFSFALVGVWFCRFLQDTVVCWSVPCSWQFIIGLVLVSLAILTVIVIVCRRVWRECIWPKLKDTCLKCRKKKK
jgi:hypothetical protein